MNDRSGRVVVNPNVPLKLQDFAQIYAGDAGLTPAQVASDLWFNAPRAGQSYMNDQWSKYGINEAPEQYFSNPDNVAAVLASTSPTSQSRSVTSNATGGVNIKSGGNSNLLAQTWPQYNSEEERNIAIDTGAYDPRYANPLKKTAETIGTNKRIQDLAAVSAHQRSLYPISAATTPAEAVRSQLAGDSYGDTKKVLQSLQKVNAEKQLDLPVDQRTPLSPYAARGGYGGKPSEEAMVSNLDFGIVNDQQFQKIMSTDPERGKYVYQSLTGRAYDADAKAHETIQNTRAKIGVAFATKQLEQGAKFDPNSGKWMVWNTVEPEDTGLSIGRAAAPTRKLVEATPEQQNWMTQYYSGVTGKAAPTVAQTNPKTQGYLGSVLNNLPPQIKAQAEEKFRTAQKETGVAPNTASRFAIIASLQEEEASKPTVWTNAGAGMGAFGKGLLGWKQDSPVTGTELLYPPPEGQRNMWGDIVAKAGNILTTPMQTNRDPIAAAIRAANSR